jgi:hypothetical protein
MKRHIVAGLFIVAVAASVGWKLASHPETSAGLEEISLNQHSEHSHSWSDQSAAKRVRVRVMDEQFGYEISATSRKIPQISLAAE